MAAGIGGPMSTAAIRRAIIIVSFLAASGAALAQKKGPVKREQLTPRATPPVRRATGETRCKADRDCTFLPSVCPRCDPCKPTWREVGNRQAARRIKALSASVDCMDRRCKSCSKKSNWLGARPVCVGGRCAVAGTSKPGSGIRPKGKAPADACLDACLARNAARAEGWKSIRSGCQRRCGKAPAAAPPQEPWSKERTCRRTADCVIRPRSPCSCPPCAPTWRRAFNRKALKTWKGKWAARRCQMPLCPACVPRYLGRKAVCVKGQCAVTR